MIYVGRAEHTSYCLRQAIRPLRQEYKEFPLGEGEVYIEDILDELIGRSEDVYVIDVLAFSDDEEMLTKSIDRLCRATNSDIIISAENENPDTRLLSGLRALGYTKIITDKENLTYMQEQFTKYIEANKVDPQDTNEDIIAAREELIDDLYKENPHLNIISEDQLEEAEAFYVDDVESAEKDFNLFDLDYSELASRKDTPKPSPLKEMHEETGEPPARQQKRTLKRAGGVVKIAVVGSMSRIGTTSLAIQLTKFLNQCEEFQAAYIEENSSGWLEDMKKFFNIQFAPHGGVVFNDISMYNDPRKISSIISEGFSYIIYDYGKYDKGREAAICDKDIIILLCGGEADEIKNATELLKIFRERNVFYVFNFISDNDMQEIQTLMEEFSDRTFFMNYCPDRFIYSPKHSSMFESIINSDYEVVLSSAATKNKRTRRLFKK